LELKNKVALVTGGSRGIGGAICRALADAGADVIVNYSQDEAGAGAVASDICSSGRQAMVVQADVAANTEVRAMVCQALNAFGHIDILVNNAGIFRGGPLEKLHEEDWDRVMDVNLKGAFLCAQAVGQHMIDRQGGGSIINIASIAGHLPEVNSGAYSPSKAAVLALTRQLAVEWAPYGIRVNSLSPGPVMTPLQRQAYPTEELLQARNRAVPLNRHGTPEEMARVVVFLASDESSYVTGADIVADGGSMVSMYRLIHQMASHR
jgi:NAD(P)-dependent dehydrogenase (short-subunit alcohol dehydrogenase family)